jgi:hypothetical protein
MLERSSRPRRLLPRSRAALALLLLLPIPSLGTAAAMFWWPGSALGNGIFFAGKLWIVVLPAAWLILADNGWLSWSPPRRGGFVVSALLGVAIAGAVVLVYLLMRRLGWLDPGLVSARARQTGLDHPGLYLAGALYWITVNSLMEEYVWRWFVFRQFEVLGGGRFAVVASALGFATHHAIALAAQFAWPMMLLGSTGVFLGGAIWSWLYLRYRSIWPCYVSHAIVDVPIFVIGYALIFGAGAGR